MASIENGLPATERTALLEVMPSAHSTNDPVHGTSYSSNGSLPLASSFDDLRESAELEMQTLIDQAKKRDPYKLPRNDILRRRHAILILFFGCTSCVMLIVLFIFQLTAPSGIYNPLPETPTALDFQPLPFSAYDPVRDLGLMEFVRPDASSPPSTLFQRNMKSKERSALPTNAWYQNMLLVRGEPSNLHRAYAVPYLLDAVGVIPGLQVIAPNRVLAGANVMQLYVEEMKGLTLGATNDLQENAENDSHKYTVLETTELGLTLHWVSALS